MMVTKAPTASKPTTPKTTKPRTSVKPLDVSAPSTSAVDTLAAGTTLVHEIPIASIDPHPRNPRQALGELGELAESIRAHGVKQPATVIPHPDLLGRYLTVMGHRRIAAAAIAGRTTVPAIIDDTMDLSEQLQVMLVENLQRVDLTISEEGAGYQGLLDLGVVKAEIVRRTGRAKNTVDARLRIAALPEAVRRHVDHHQLTIEEAIAFGEWKDKHPEVWEESLKKLENSHVMVDVVFGQAKGKVAGLEAKDKATADLAAAGYKLVVDHQMIPYNDPRSIVPYGISVADHAHCPGAEIHITGTSPDWFINASRWGDHLCTDVEKYHPAEFAARNAPRVESDDEREWREKRESEVAEVQAARAAVQAVAHARREWLVYVLTLKGPEAAPAYAALADVAAMVAAGMLTEEARDSQLLEVFDPWAALPEDAVLPTNPLSLMTLTMLLALDANMPSNADRVDAEWETADLKLLAAYLEACKTHGHVLDESEELVLRAAEFALDNQATAAVDEGQADDDAEVKS